MHTLEWRQVNVWRLWRHHLIDRAAPEQMLDVVSRIGAVHAQLMSAAELQLAARVRDLTPTDVQNALWRDRTLVKTWALRGTLHLLVAREFPLYVAALSTLAHYRRGSWLKYHGVTIAELDAIIEGVRETLGNAPMTREQLADALAERAQAPHLRELLRSGWGVLLKPAAFQGHLCFGPNQGQNVTFVQPRAWIGTWPAIDPEHALQEILRRFLAAYGPATIDEFARWFGLEPSKAKKLFRSLGDEASPIDVEGWQAFAMRSSIEEMQKSVPSNSVRLLPHFDPYTIAVARHAEYLLPPAEKPRVYRSQGWISPVVLVDGYIQGVWEYEKQRAQLIVTVSMFAAPTSEVRDGIEAEARRLGGFLDTDIRLVYA